MSWRELYFINESKTVNKKTKKNPKKKMKVKENKNKFKEDTKK